MKRWLITGAAVVAGAAVLMVASRVWDRDQKSIRHQGTTLVQIGTKPQGQTPAEGVSRYDDKYTLPPFVDERGREWPHVPMSYPGDREAAVAAVQDALWDPNGVRWMDLVTMACRDDAYGEWRIDHDTNMFQARYPGGREVHLLELGAPPDDAVSRWEFDEYEHGGSKWEYTLIWPIANYPEVAGVSVVLEFEDTGHGWCYAGPEDTMIYSTNHADSFERRYHEVAEAGGSWF